MVPLAERTAPYFAKDPDLYNSEDDFHPSAAGYARWADAIYPYLRQALQSAE
jgi:lysophospholipase L1-like esterase